MDKPFSSSSPEPESPATAGCRESKPRGEPIFKDSASTPAVKNQHTWRYKLLQSVKGAAALLWTLMLALIKSPAVIFLMGVRMSLWSGRAIGHRGLAGLRLITAAIVSFAQGLLRGFQSFRDRTVACVRWMLMCGLDFLLQTLETLMQNKYGITFAMLKQSLDKTTPAQKQPTQDDLLAKVSEQLSWFLAEFAAFKQESRTHSASHSSRSAQEEDLALQSVPSVLATAENTGHQFQQQAQLNRLALSHAEQARQHKTLIDWCRRLDTKLNMLGINHQATLQQQRRLNDQQQHHHASNTAMLQQILEKSDVMQSEYLRPLWGASQSQGAHNQANQSLLEGAASSLVQLKQILDNLLLSHRVSSHDRDSMMSPYTPYRHSPEADHTMPINPETPQTIDDRGVSPPLSSRSTHVFFPSHEGGGCSPVEQSLQYSSPWAASETQHTQLGEYHQRMEEMVSTKLEQQLQVMLQLLGELILLAQHKSEEEDAFEPAGMLDSVKEEEDTPESTDNRHTEQAIQQLACSFVKDVINKAIAQVEQEGSSQKRKNQGDSPAIFRELTNDLSNIGFFEKKSSTLASPALEIA